MTSECHFDTLLQHKLLLRTSDNVTKLFTKRETCAILFSRNINEVFLHCNETHLFSPKYSWNTNPISAKYTTHLAKLSK